MCYVPVCCKTLELGRKGAAFNLSEKSHSVGDIVKIGNDAFTTFEQFVFDNVSKCAT